MTKIATIDWFGRWGTSVFCENTAIFLVVSLLFSIVIASLGEESAGIYFFVYLYV